MVQNARQILPLSKIPHLYSKVVSLIESSFGYQPQYKFEEDFALLVNKDNLSHCYALIDENENILAHIGTLSHALTYKSYDIPVTLFGGIAVNEQFRGQGHFRELFEYVLNIYKDKSALLLLWSDKVEMYNKFDFYLVGENFAVESEIEEHNFEKTNLHSISTEDLKQIKSLYEQNYRDIMHMKREDTYWENLKLITSASLYLKRDSQNKIQGYFFQGKGQDLPNIIYEFAGFDPLELSRYGQVWTPIMPHADHYLHHLGFIRLGNPFLVIKMTDDIWGFDITFKDGLVMMGEIAFTQEQFLRFLFGPKGETISMKKPLFISGLESI